MKGMLFCSNAKDSAVVSFMNFCLVSSSYHMPILYSSYSFFQGNIGPGSCFLVGAISECAKIFTGGIWYLSTISFTKAATFLICDSSYGEKTFLPTESKIYLVLTISITIEVSFK